MAANTIPTFRNANDFLTLLATVEELAVMALDEQDPKHRASILWAVQKLSEAGRRDFEQIEMTAN